MSERGDGSYTRGGNGGVSGNSYANGPWGLLKVLGPEFRMMREASFDRWSVQA